MHAKPDLRVILKWMIAGSGSVITDVIPLESNLALCMKPALTKLELDDLAKVARKPLEKHRRELKLHGIYAATGFAVVSIGLVWLYVSRNPTVVQAMWFCGAVVFASSLGYYISACLNHKYIRMIHHLKSQIGDDDESPE